MTIGASSTTRPNVRRRASSTIPASASSATTQYMRIPQRTGLAGRPSAVLKKTDWSKR